MLSFCSWSLPALLFVPGNAWSCNDHGATEVLTKVPLGQVDPLAVCNDGSEAAYYYKDNGNPHLWVVYLGGGGWCHDKASCDARFDGSGYPHHDCRNSSEASPCFMSSKDYSDACAKTGLFDSDQQHTPLYNANKIYVPYCSSDGHMGDGEFEGWQFRGARIARAVVKDLQNRGLRAGESTLIWSGGSAGGRGAMVLLDEVAESLQGVNVLGFLDSNYYIDVASYSADFAGFQPQHPDVLQNFNAYSVVGEACAAAHYDNQWRCLFGQFRMPFVKTPYLMVASQYDAWQLSHLVQGYDGILKTPTLSDDEKQYAERFGAQTRELSKTLPSAASAAGIIYSAACYNHHVAEKDLFWTVTTSKGESQKDALQMLIHKGSRAKGWMVDDCESYDCGLGCHPSAVTMV